MQRECFAVPGNNNIIDEVHTVTGRGVFSNETLEQVQVRYPGAVRMPIAKWTAAKGALQDTPVTWIPVTKKHYNDMLNFLPPERMARGAFIVGEPADHHAVSGLPRYSMFRAINGQLQESSRPVTVAEFTTLVEASR
jgi:hypothetical protein